MTSLQTSSPLSAAPKLLAEGKLQEAAALARDVLAQDAGNADAHHLLGVVALHSGDYAEAVRLIEQALALKPDMVAALYNHGIALAKLKRNAEAIESFTKALTLRPYHVEALVNRAAVFQAQGDFALAMQDLTAALAMKPQLFEAHLAMGNVLLALQRWEDADAALAEALRLRPTSAVALNSRGVALGGRGNHDGALASFTAALSHEPSAVDILANRAKALRHLNRFVEARDDLRQLLRISPGMPTAEISLLIVQLTLCDWSSYTVLAPKARDQFLLGPATLSPFDGLLLLPSAADQFAYARRYAARHFDVARAATDPPQRHRIHICYVSADFRNHPVSYLLAGVLEGHDRSCFHVTAVAIGPRRNDEMRSRIVDAVDRFLELDDVDAAADAALLRREAFDIAVDLGGYTNYCRTALFAHGIAPVQVLYLGYAGTLGGTFMDYVLADRIVIPEEDKRFFSECVVYLPDTHQPNDSRRVVGSDLLTRAHHGLPERGPVLCCFNNVLKLSPPIFDVWARILVSVPAAVLWLPDAGPEVCANLRREAHERGVDPSRLIFASKTPDVADHLARLAHADLVLDTLPYNSHATLSDALWAGVPAITCRGESFAGRVGASLLSAVGLPELVTTTLEDYAQLAIALASEPSRLGAIRKKLAARATSPLFDTARFTLNLESAFAMMHERRLLKAPPASFSVSDS